MVDDIENIKVGEPLRIRDPNGSDIVIECVVLGTALGWHLQHGKKHIITRNVVKIKKYIEDCARQCEIVDLGEY